jgi:hypothetical protein
MNWNKCRRKRSWPNFKVYPGICPERLGETTNNHSHDSRSVGRNLNPGPPEYKAGVLTTRPRRSTFRILQFQRPLRGPRKWVRELAVRRYPIYPVSGGIAGQPCLRQYKYRGLVLKVGGWAWGWQPHPVKRFVESLLEETKALLQGCGATDDDDDDDAAADDSCNVTISHYGNHKKKEF